MAKSKISENRIKLVCTDCEKNGKKHYNYYTRKNKKLVERKIEVKKHCPFCRKHTVHKEAKK